MELSPPHNKYYVRALVLMRLGGSRSILRVFLFLSKYNASAAEHRVAEDDTIFVFSIIDVKQIGSKLMLKIFVKRNATFTGK